MSAIATHDPVDASIGTLHFAAMGSPCSVSILDAGPGDSRFDLAVRRVEELETAWSRFRPHSELSLLNAAGSATVSHDTFLLIDHAVTAWKWTNGLFDPTVLSVMTASGYDRTFSAINRTTTSSARLPRASGCGGIELDPDRRTVVLPAGTGLDPGGIGKGLAADLVAECLLSYGATGVCVNLGGDIRTAGQSPVNGWPVGIADPGRPDHQVAMLRLTDHGLATSNRLTRSWIRNGVTRNHLVDPRTSASASGPVAASVLAGQAWWAEVLTKVAMIGGPMAGPMIDALGGHLLSFDEHGNVSVSPGLHLTD